MAKNKTQPDPDETKEGETAEETTANAPGGQTDERVADLEQQLLRVRADFENHKRRTAEEQFRIASVAQTDLVLRLLPVIDNFDRAFSDVPKDIKDSPWYAGVAAIKQQFEGLLADLGIERIKTVGEEFDPALHEAVSNEPSDEYDKDIISEEFAAGYRQGDDIIRHSKVKVSSGKKKK